MAKIDQIIHTIELPDGVTHSIDCDTLTLSKDGSQITRDFRHSRVSVRVSDGSIEVHCDLPRRREKALSGTWAAHIRNMVKGIDTGFTYRLKAVYSHFPMTIKVQGNEMSITNLFGEKVPRIAPLPWSPADVKVEVKNKVDVFVSGADIEKVGQTAANIERACRIRKRDRRVFQDGIYIVAKAETE
ncbi:MAG TPA: 50S ribosomal protein L6 [Candidatus Thalassarchaeaceae archaeon]|nr:MAG TPA: 50S ribosomal protein L6 [Candidatus Poseidoniales archaeon]HII48694.1 50S ribosomal protein L6 [Candidatus Thalassarchaeaceae archaeon]